MKITLYRNASPPNVMNKELTQIWEGTGTFRRPASVLTPEFDVAADLSEYLHQFNYFYIDVYHRYYYLNDVVPTNNSLYAVSGTVDVLMSWREQILNNYAVVSRQEFQYNNKLPDQLYKAYSNPLIQRLNFPSGLTSDSIILVVAGPNS